MALNKNDQTRIRDFLLGKLSNDEEREIEERLLVEDELFEELEISKGELVECYCANELSPDEQRWFERNFLASTEGRERYALALTLSHLSSSVPERTRRRRLWEMLNDLLKQRPWMIATATATAGILIVSAILLSRQTGQTVVGPTLASNLINREQGTLPPKVSIPSDATALRFRLLLPTGFLAGANYRAELDNKIDIEPVKVLEHDREGVWIVIPVTLLPRGEYSLKLVAISSEGAEREIPGDYLFNVE